MKYNNYISIGNNCAPALAFRDLKLKTITYPFDWIPTTINVIYDILEKGPDKFLIFNNSSTLITGINEELIEFQTKNNPGFPESHINAYNCWFVHDIDLTTQQLKEQYTRRYERLIEILTNKSNDSILFVHTNESGIYYKSFRDNEIKYYQTLLKLEELLINKFNLSNFKIINYSLNVFLDTVHIKNIQIKWDHELSDNGELHIETIYNMYRTLIRNSINELTN